jgi:hypothetical protein
MSYDRVNDKHSQRRDASVRILMIDSKVDVAVSLCSARSSTRHPGPWPWQPSLLRSSLIKAATIWTIMKAGVREIRGMLARQEA